jgi:DNA-binding MltR family transcriptional regulator
MILRQTIFLERKIMDQETSNNFDYFTDDFLQEIIPRTIVIVASSKIDDLLAEIISKYLLPKVAKNNDQDELLGNDRPLASFSTRIKTIYRLGFVDKSFYVLLELIRNIRNLSAHELSFDINKSPLKEHFANLNQKIKKRDSFKLAQQRYFSDIKFDKITEIKCCFLTICVLLEAINSRIEKVVPNATLIGISMK